MQTYQGGVLIWNVDQLGKEPITVPREDLGIEDEADWVHLLTCKTHLIAIVGDSFTPLISRIRARPLSSVLMGAMDISAKTGTVDNIIFQDVTMLRDSTVNPKTGVTEVVLVGVVRTSWDEVLLMMVRLLIPPLQGPLSDGQIQVFLERLLDFAFDPCLILTPSWTGSMRIVWSIEEPSYGRLAAVEVVYGDGRPTASITYTPNLGVASGVQKLFWHHDTTELQSFENEPYLGRVLYVYDAQDERPERSFDAPKEERMKLCLLEFS